MTYEEVKKIRENPTFNDVDNIELSKMIDNAIEKQIPMKALHHYADFDVRYDNWWSCESCGHEIPYGWGFCKNCGQAIDWGEE